MTVLVDEQGYRVCFFLYVSGGLFYLNCLDSSISNRRSVWLDVLQRILYIMQTI